MRTVYTTTVNDTDFYTGEDLEKAIRVWDMQTHGLDNATGGIGVQTFDGDWIIRDGWILHVDNGRVFLNPNLKG